MKIYEIGINDGFAWSRLKGWEPGVLKYDVKILESKKNLFTDNEEMYFIDDKEVITEPTKDFKFDIVGYEPGFMYFNEKAIELLKDMFDETHEFIPVNSVNGKYWLLNFMDFVEGAVDYDNSEFSWIDEQEPRAFDYSKITFNEEKLKGKHIFKIDPLRVSMFVDEEFKNTCYNNGIHLFKFKEVYNSEK